MSGRFKRLKEKLYPKDDDVKIFIEFEYTNQESTWAHNRWGRIIIGKDINTADAYNQALESFLKKFPNVTEKDIIKVRTHIVHRP